jgi:ribosomal-protein-alanine N-acetyltransferase
VQPTDDRAQAGSHQRNPIADVANPPTYFPTLWTDRLILRPLAMADVDFVFQHFGDPRVARYLMDEPPVADYCQARAIINFYLEPEGKNHNRWAIVRQADNRLIGTCGYHKWAKAHFRAEIGYDLSPDCWGQGFMTEALRAAIGNGFERMGLHRIEVLVYVDNDRSIRLLQRLGFKQEGLLRGYFCRDGVYYDHHLFALLRQEWEG